MHHDVLWPAPLNPAALERCSDDLLRLLSTLPSEMLAHPTRGTPLCALHPLHSLCNSAPSKHRWGLSSTQGGACTHSSRHCTLLHNSRPAPSSLEYFNRQAPWCAVTPCAPVRCHPLHGRSSCPPSAPSASQSNSLEDQHALSGVSPSTHISLALVCSLLSSLLLFIIVCSFTSCCTQHTASPC